MEKYINLIAQGVFLEIATFMVFLPAKVAQPTPIASGILKIRDLPQVSEVQEKPPPR